MYHNNMSPRKGSSKTTGAKLSALYHATLVHKLDMCIWNRSKLCLSTANEVELTWPLHRGRRRYSLELIFLARSGTLDVL